MQSIYCHIIYNLLNLYRIEERIDPGIMGIYGRCNDIQDNHSDHTFCLLGRGAGEGVVCSLTVWALNTQESRAVLQQFVLSPETSALSAVCYYVKPTTQF